MSIISPRQSVKEYLEQQPLPWYANTYRKLFFDYHNRASVHDLGAKFDAQAWADQLRQAHVQAVSIFVSCGQGFRYYRRGKIGHIHPRLADGLDMVQEQIDAFAQRDIRTIGYYYTFGNPLVAREHPDWIEHNVDGTPHMGNNLSSPHFCLIGPFAQQYLYPQLAEIVENYDLDGLFFDGTFAKNPPCHCPHCKAAFAKVSGGQSIPEHQDDPQWQAYANWKLQTFRELRQNIVKTINAIKPDMLVTFNWALTTRQPEAVADNIKALVADVFPEDQVFESSFQASYFSTQQRPFDVMNTAFLQWWGDWGCKPAIAMQQELATILAHGGMSWIGYQMTHAFEVPQAVMDEFAKTMEFVQQRESVLQDSLGVPDIAVLLSTQQPWLSTLHPLQCSETATRGVHRMFNELNLSHAFYPGKQLLESLDQIRMVVLPDQPVVDEALADALPPWVTEGGVLLVSGRTWTQDINGKPAKQDGFEHLLGVQRGALLDESHLYLDAIDDRLTPGSMKMAHLLEAPCPLIASVASDVDVLGTVTKPYKRDDGHYLRLWSPAGEPTDHPALTLHKVGQGSVIYFAPDLFHALSVKNQWNLKPILRNLLDMVGFEPRVKVTSTPWIESVLRYQPRLHRYVLHLVNHHGSPRPIDKNNYCLEEVVPVHDIQITMQWDHKHPPQSVRMEPDGQLIPFAIADRHLLLTVPRVDLHCAVVIETE